MGRSNLVDCSVVVIMINMAVDQLSPSTLNLLREFVIKHGGPGAHATTGSAQTAHGGGGGKAIGTSAPKARSRRRPKVAPFGPPLVSTTTSDVTTTGSAPKARSRRSPKAAPFGPPRRSSRRTSGSSTAAAPTEAKPYNPKSFGRNMRASLKGAGFGTTGVDQDHVDRYMVRVDQILDDAAYSRAPIKSTAHQGQHKKLVPRTGTSPYSARKYKKADSWKKPFQEHLWHAGYDGREIRRFTNELGRSLNDLKQITTSGNRRIGGAKAAQTRRARRVAAASSSAS